MKKILIISLLTCFLSTNTFADQKIEGGKTITTFGVEGTQNGYFRVAETLAAPCKYNVIYYVGSSYLSLLLAAKMADKKLSVVAYNIDVNNVCTLFSVEMQ